MRLTGLPVTVAGAGIAGLAVARALALRGAAVTVVEQAPAITEAGAGVQVSPNGNAALRALGLEPELEGVSLRTTRAVLCRGRDGLPVLAMDLSRTGIFRLVHRADLIGLLAAGARDAGVTIRLGRRVEGGTLDPLLASAGAPALLIGADGIRSALRPVLNGPSAPVFTGQVAWRATIPDTPGAFPEAEVHMGPGRHLVSYPLRGGTMRNLVAVEERAEWTAEGWSIPDDPAHLRQSFAAFGPRVQRWLDRVEETWLWGLHLHPVAQVWQAVRPEWAVAILGDAAHPTLPFLAQGANLALEDAWVLADCLYRHDDLAAGLTAYQTQRAPRVARVVKAAATSARLYHLHPPLALAAQAVLGLGGRVAPGFAMSRLGWIYRHDVTLTN